MVNARSVLTSVARLLPSNETAALDYIQLAPVRSAAAPCHALSKIYTGKVQINVLDSLGHSTNSIYTVNPESKKLQLTALYAACF